MGRGDLARVRFELLGIEQLSAKWNRRSISLNVAAIEAFRSRGKLEATRQRMLRGSQYVWHLVRATRLKNLAPIARRPLQNVALLRPKIDQLHAEIATNMGHLGGKLKLIAQDLNDAVGGQSARARAGDQRAELD